MHCKRFVRLLWLIVVVVMTRRVDAANPIELFNGRDLAGWTYHLDDPKVKMDGVWNVKDGVLRCTGKPTGYLVTKKNDYENYVLSVEWRWPDKGGNNGVLVHVTTPSALGVWPKCLEIQLGSGDAGDLWVIGTTLDMPNIEKSPRRPAAP